MWVMPICISKLTIMGSDDGLLPGLCQAIICTDAGILLIRPLESMFNVILIRIHIFSFMEIHLKLPSEKWWLFCVSLSVLEYWGGNNNCHFADSILKWIFFNANILTLIRISVIFVPKCPINNKPSVVQVMVLWTSDGHVYGCIYTSLCFNVPMQLYHGQWKY